MRRISKIFLLLCMLVGSRCLAQNGLRVTYYDGNVQSFNVADAGKLYFASDNLNIKPSQSAAITTIPVSIIRKITFFDTTTLVPVNLVSFTAASSNCSAVIKWESGSEESFSYYELRYGTTSLNLNLSRRVASKGSNSSYSATLPDLTGKYYYRLKMVDVDGAVKYSDIISNQIDCSSVSGVAVYPNPAGDVIRIKTVSVDKQDIKIFTSKGQLVKQGAYSAGDDINISALLPGLYLVKINGFTVKLIKK